MRAAGIALLLSLLCSASQGALPARPQGFVFDEPKVLDAKFAAGLDALLNQHAHATGEQIFVAILSDLQKENTKTLTDKLFSEWKVGRKGKDDGALIAFFWKQKKGAVRAGYGLESLLTDTKIDEILSNSLPDLKWGDPRRAASIAALGTLRAIESPLAANGEAQKMLRVSGFEGDFEPIEAPVVPWMGPILLLLGLAAVAIALNWVLSAEAHFSGTGWFRPTPWKLMSKGKLSGGGGADGSW